MNTRHAFIKRQKERKKRKKERKKKKKKQERKACNPVSDDEAGIVLTVLPLTSNGIMKIRIIPTTPYEDFNGTIPGVYFHDQNTFLGSCDIDVRRNR